jgi:hypothetical protein
MELKCDYCNSTFTVKPNSIGSRKRSIRLGLPIYCNKKCTGLAIRTNETEEEKKLYKQWYDLFIRVSRTEDEYWLKYLQTAFSFAFDYAANPEKYKRIRQGKKESHNEYCRQPEYKKKKKAYDEVHRAKKFYGEYWEAAIALKTLENEIDDKEGRRLNKLYNKSTTKRKRSWQKQLKQNIKNLRQLI